MNTQWLQESAFECSITDLQLMDSTQGKAAHLTDAESYPSLNL